MKQTQLLKFFLLHRQIFGLCPNSGEIFRLSDCNIYLKKKDKPNWYEKICQEHTKLDNQEDEIREIARGKGRQQAQRTVKKIDTIFSPNKLHHCDAYGIFHPIDYIVFNGMEKDNCRNILLMDSKKHSSEMRRVQNSIEKVIEKENYEWVTFRVNHDGYITIE